MNILTVKIKCRLEDMVDVTNHFSVVKDMRRLAEYESAWNQTYTNQIEWSASSMDDIASSSVVSRLVPVIDPEYMLFTKEVLSAIVEYLHGHGLTPCYSAGLRHIEVEYKGDSFHIYPDLYVVPVMNTEVDEVREQLAMELQAIFIGITLGLLNIFNIFKL